jgi:hypothetical protein
MNIDISIIEKTNEKVVLPNKIPENHPNQKLTGKSFQAEHLTNFMKTYFPN